MLILGLNAYHGDSSACILKDGTLLAAVEEERFLRIKHWAGFPQKSIEYCLDVAKANIEDLDYIAINRDPKANFYQKVFFTLKGKPKISLVIDRLKNKRKVKSLQDIFTTTWPESKLKAKIIYVYHHLAHVASSFFVSGMQEAALCSIDGFGDFASTLTGVGRNNEIEISNQVFFPHSLGLFYLAITQYLGFPKYGDEYKVMGLSPYGKPNLMKEMEKIVRIQKDGFFKLGLEYFCHHKSGGKMTWEGGEPHIEKVYSSALEKLLGPARNKQDEITQHHKDIAASMQKMYENAFFSILEKLYSQTKLKNLAFSGGCAMNSVANGKILANSNFEEIYISSAAGDAGGSIGAAYHTYNNILKQPRIAKLNDAYLGPGYNADKIESTLSSSEQLQQGIAEGNLHFQKVENEDTLTEIVSQAIVEGKVIGWFQGRMEWGPRALGNRSIIVDPRRTDMQEILNAKIKRRESFRPFAPSILREFVAEYFETDYEVPFMMMVFQIKKEKHSEIPAVTHVDGSGRLQTVTAEENSLYYKLIHKFYEKTKVPLVLNTSFNENEPIVNTPQQALDCFLRTKMDLIVMDHYIVSRN